MQTIQPCRCAEAMADAARSEANFRSAIGSAYHARYHAAHPFHAALPDRATPTKGCAVFPADLCADLCAGLCAFPQILLIYSAPAPCMGALVRSP